MSAPAGQGHVATGRAPARHPGPATPPARPGPGRCRRRRRCRAGRDGPPRCAMPTRPSSPGGSRPRRGPGPPTPVGPPPPDDARHQSAPVWWRAAGAARPGRRCSCPRTPRTRSPARAGRRRWSGTVRWATPGVAEAHGQVATALPGGHHQAAGQALEGDVPQPRRVVPVGDAGVDADHDGVGRRRRAGRGARPTRPGSWPGAGARAPPPGRPRRSGPRPRRRDRAMARQRASAASDSEHAARPSPPWPRWPGCIAREARGAGGRRAVGRTSVRRRRSHGVGPGPAEAAACTHQSVGRPRRRRSARRTAGQPTASWRHSWPAATHTHAGARRRAAHTTNGSSALATTVAVGSPARPARQRSATMRTSLIRSSWSRDRLSSDDHLGGRRVGHGRPR